MDITFSTKTFLLHKTSPNKNKKFILMAACLVLHGVNIGWNRYEMLVIGTSNNETFLTDIASYCVLCLHGNNKFYVIPAYLFLQIRVNKTQNVCKTSKIRYA